MCLCVHIVYTYITCVYVLCLRVCMYICVHTYRCVYVCTYVYLLYFAWEDQRQKQHFIYHEMPSVLYKNTAQWLTYSMVVLINVHKKANCYLFPSMYIDFYHLIHGFTDFYYIKWLLFTAT